VEFFKDNLVNWIILALAVAFMWSKIMPGVFGSRRQKIKATLDEATRSKDEGKAFLEEQRARIANAEAESQRILVEARETAEAIRKQGAEDAKKDAADLERKLAQQIDTHRQMVITELRAQAAIAAVRLAEASLPGAITDSVKKGLQERFVTQLDSLGAKQ
jgi:F-type H+-transporting ATPase subunit b